MNTLSHPLPVLQGPVPATGPHIPHVCGWLFMWQLAEMDVLRDGTGRVWRRAHGLWRCEEAPYELSDERMRQRLHRIGQRHWERARGAA